MSKLMLEGHVLTAKDCQLLADKQEELNRLKNENKQLKEQDAKIKAQIAFLDGKMMSCEGLNGLVFLTKDGVQALVPSEGGIKKVALEEVQNGETVVLKQI